MLVAVPEQPLDPLEGVQQALTHGFVVMGDAVRILFKHGHTHGDAEPIQHMLGNRGDLFGQGWNSSPPSVRKVTS